MADVIQWDKVMGKKVRSIDREDIGKVENVNTDSIEVKDGSDDNLITTMTKKDIHDKFSADNPVADLWKAPKD